MPPSCSIARDLFVCACALFPDFFLLFPRISLTGRSFTSAPSSKSEQFVFIEIESVEIEYIGPRMAKLASDLAGVRWQCRRARVRACSADGHAAPPPYQCLWAGQYLPILLLSTTVLKKLASYVCDSTTYSEVYFFRSHSKLSFWWSGSQSSIMAPYFFKEIFFLKLCQIMVLLFYLFHFDL